MIKILQVLLLLLLSACGSLSPVKEPTEEDMNQQALKAYEEVKKTSPLSTDKEMIKIVERVSQRIARASGENFQWEVILIDKNEVNAWCMPGGKMAVYTGILPVLKNEAALAAVMGHEVSHATLRHGKERYVRAMKNEILSQVIGGAVVLGGQSLCKTEKCKLLTALGGVATGFALAFFDRKFSREDETSADFEGQKLMAKAGYDPREAPNLWDRMREANGGKSGPEWLSTHPSDERRKENLNQWMKEAEKIYQSSTVKYGLGVSLK